WSSWNPSIRNGWVTCTRSPPARGPGAQRPTTPRAGGRQPALPAYTDPFEKLVEAGVPEWHDHPAPVTMPTAPAPDRPEVSTDERPASRRRPGQRQPAGRLRLRGRRAGPRPRRRRRDRPRRGQGDPVRPRLGLGLRRPHAQPVGLPGRGRPVQRPPLRPGTGQAGPRAVRPQGRRRPRGRRRRLGLAGLRPRHRRPGHLRPRPRRRPPPWPWPGSPPTARPSSPPVPSSHSAPLPPLGERARLTPLAPCAMFRASPLTQSPQRKGAAAMYGPLIISAAILLSIAGLVLFLHDLAEARSRKAFDRIFEEGSKRRR